MATSKNGFEPDDPDRHYRMDWVTIEGMFGGHPMQVVLDQGDRVWVGASYADDLPEGAAQIGDGLNNGYDIDGNRLVSVPAGWCTFITSDDAFAIEQCMKVDQMLLDYAA